MKKADKKSKVSLIREWVESIIVAGLIAIFLKTFFFQIYKIPTTSMNPTLKPNDKIFVSKIVYGPKIPFTSWRIKGFKKPQRGEVVVFVPPHEAGKFWLVRKPYIKRLIGLEGERVLIKDGRIFVNGKEIVDPGIATHHYYNQGEYGAQDEEITIPKGKYFFLGDNSMSSLDSRYWGFADEKDIIGKAIFIWWPPKRAGMIE